MYTVASGIFISCYLHFWCHFNIISTIFKSIIFDRMWFCCFIQSERLLLIHWIGDNVLQLKRLIKNSNIFLNIKVKNEWSRLCLIIFINNFNNYIYVKMRNNNDKNMLHCCCYCRHYNVVLSAIASKIYLKLIQVTAIKTVRDPNDAF